MATVKYSYLQKSCNTVQTRLCQYACESTCCLTLAYQDDSRTFKPYSLITPSGHASHRRTSEGLRIGILMVSISFFLLPVHLFLPKKRHYLYNVIFLPLHRATSAGCLTSLQLSHKSLLSMIMAVVGSLKISQLVEAVCRASMGRGTRLGMSRKRQIFGSTFRNMFWDKLRTKYISVKGLSLLKRSA